MTNHRQLHCVHGSAQEIFGKVMSISDPLMFRYFELLTDVSGTEIARWKAEVGSGACIP